MGAKQTKKNTLRLTKDHLGVWYKLQVDSVPISKTFQWTSWHRRMEFLPLGASSSSSGAKSLAKMGTCCPQSSFVQQSPDIDLRRERKMETFALRVFTTEKALKRGSMRKASQTLREIEFLGKWRAKGQGRVGWREWEKEHSGHWHLRVHSRADKEENVKWDVPTGVEE